MLHESFHSLKIDFASRFKALRVTNALDGSEGHLLLEQVYSLAAKELIVFWNDLMEKPRPKSLKDLMKMITPPKNVDCMFDEILEDEDEESFNCEGHEIGVAPSEANDDPNDEISDGEDNFADNDHMTGEGASMGEANTTHGKISSIVKLADMCRDDDDDDDLKKDVKLIDNMSTLLLNYEASNKLMSMYLNMQHRYIKA